jgi:hypothetical protein
MRPTIALVTAGVEMDVLGIAYPAFTHEQRDDVCVHRPREGNFKENIIEHFAHGIMTCIWQWRLQRYGCRSKQVKSQPRSPGANAALSKGNWTSSRRFTRESSPRWSRNLHATEAF